MNTPSSTQNGKLLLKMAWDKNVTGALKGFDINFQFAKPVWFRHVHVSGINLTHPFFTTE